MSLILEFPIDNLRPLDTRRGFQISFMDCREKFGLTYSGRGEIFDYLDSIGHGDVLREFTDTFEYLSHQHVFAHYSILLRWHDDNS